MQLFGVGPSPFLGVGNFKIDYLGKLQTLQNQTSIIWIFKLKCINLYKYYLTCMANCTYIIHQKKCINIHIFFKPVTQLIYLINYKTITNTYILIITCKGYLMNAPLVSNRYVLDVYDYHY